MTTVYFIRHAEPDINVHDDQTRPLTPKGEVDTELVTEYLKDKGITAVLSSPFKRSYDTVHPFAQHTGLPINTVDGLRERKVSDEWIPSFGEFTQKQWADFDYKLPTGESLREAQARTISALTQILDKYNGQNIAVGTHGTALSTIINFYDGTFGYNGFSKYGRVFPWIVKMLFVGRECIGYELIDPFNHIEPDFNTSVNTFYLYPTHEYCRIVVIFARYQNKWLYCRARERDCYETPGGRAERGETPMAAAKRELYEETGATDFTLTPAYDYTLHYSNTFVKGRVFLAEIEELSDMPSYEMAEVKLFDTIPNKMRFPTILPELFKRLKSECFI
ncbi:MAG: histidine phosphatase family protein [Defluviitaleaceae bacterium]|nr:histidine phosphatase family protein [Defluviitaleaceae bacterium]